MTTLKLRTLIATSCLLLTACYGERPAEMPKDAETLIQDRAEDLLSRMSLEEKIGQIIQADISAVTPEQVRTYNLGSVLNGGNSAPGGGKVAPPEEWIALADDFWEASTDTSDGGVGIPLLWGTDAVHGHNNLQEATIFPHNIGLGAMNDPAVMKDIAAATAQEIRATGLDWTFAPTLAVARDDRWGRAYESYSEKPEIVAQYADSIVRGLQGKPGSDDFLVGDHVMATAKHFIGDGGTEFGIDKGDTVGEWDEIFAIHGAGYKPAIDADVQSVMASFSSVNGEKMHGSKRLLTDVLRGELGFDGFVVGDWNGHGEVPGCTPTNCPAALDAGIDMYMAPDSWEGLYQSLLAQAQSGELNLERLDEAVLRILKVKLRSGLFEAGLPSERASADPAQLGTEDHQAIARRAVRQSLVLLKNQNDLLPIAANARIVVTGSGADSMEQQTGGWTLNWQGTGNSNDEFMTGETIFEGIQQAVSDAGGTAVLSTDGSGAEEADVAIVVFGETPYAEYRGDRTDLVYEFDDGADLALVRDLKAQGLPVVSVFLTGRPLWVNPHLNASDAFVVAWLPGTEGAGVADVIIADASGDARHDFTGRLSFSWPSDGAGEPINDASDPGVLFPYGYGLSYGSDEAWEDLPEEPGVTRPDFAGTIIETGDAVAPFALYLGDTSNANTPVSGLTGESLGGAISVRGIDYRAQEDARQVNWAGTARASVKTVSGRPVDLSALGLGTATLAIEWKVDTAPARAAIAIGCGDGCGATLNVDPLVTAAEGQDWTVTSIPVSCFVSAGLDPSAIRTGFELSAEGEGQIAIASVTVSDAADELSCPSEF